MRVLLASAVLGLVMAAALPAAAQEAQDDPPERLTGLSIEAIVLEAAPGEDEGELLALSGLAVGDPFSPSRVRRAVKLLYQLGRFENVKVRAARIENRVRLRLILPPRGIVRELRVLASEELTESEIEEAIGVSTDSQIDPRRVPEMRDALQAALRERGFRDAAVGMALVEADDRGGLFVLVRIDEGPQIIADQIVVEGEPHMPAWELRRKLGVSGGDVVDLRRVRAELERLEQEYDDRGYWDAQIGMPEVQRLQAMHDGHPLARLVFRIEAGPRTEVRLVGNQRVSTRSLMKETEVFEELGTGPSVVAEVKERILSKYHRRGFWKVRVEERVTTSADGERRIVAFFIREGARGRVVSVAFPGNVEVDEKDLEARLHEVVAQAMADELGKPGADPAMVGDIVGDSSLDIPRASPQPDTTSPDPEDIYIARAYRTAGDAIGDLYRARGYQTVEVGDPLVTPREDVSMLDVQIPIRPGVKWLVGALSFTGNEAVSSTRLFELAGIDPTAAGGRAVSFDDVEEARRAILTHYKNLGHLYVRVAEDLRQVPPRGSLGTFGYVSSSTVAPLDVRSVCLRAEEAGEATCDVELVFRIDEGPRVTTRDVIVRGVNKTQEGVVQGEIVVEDGKVLRQRDMLDTRDNLLRVGVFERVTVRPLDEEQVAAEKDVVVEVRERKAYSLELGVGASTEEGLRTFAGFGNANVLGTALRLQLLGKLNVFLPQLLLLYEDPLRSQIEDFYDKFTTLERFEYELAAGVSYPRIFGLPPGFTAGLDLIAFRDYDPAFAENTQKVTLIGNYKGFRPTVAGGPRPVAIQLRADFERASLTCGAVDRPDLCSSEPTLGNPDRVAGSNIYVSLGPSVSWDLRDEPLNPTAGAYLEVETAFAKGLDGISPDHVSLEGRANFYVPAPYVDGVVLAVSVLGGRLFPFGGGEVPFNRRFFSGGRRTIRGYPEKTLVPQDAEVGADGRPLNPISPGGELMIAVKSELRIDLFGPVAVALFYDVGDLWLDGDFALYTEQVVAPPPAEGLDPVVVTRSLAHGFGLGLRIATPIGPLAVDFAVPLNRSDARSPQLHFAVGTF